MLTMRHKSSLQHPSQYARMPSTTGVKKYIQNYQRQHFILLDSLEKSKCNGFLTFKVTPIHIRHM